MLPSLISQLAGRGPSSSDSLVSEFLAQEQRRAKEARSLSSPAGGAQPKSASPAPVPGSAGAHLAPNLPGSLYGATPTYSQSLGGAAFRLDQYHTLEEIYAFMDALAARYPQRVHVFTVGKTAEQRPIKALELINNATDADFVWLDALTHAREWITGTTILYTLDKLVVGGAGSGSAGAAQRAAGLHSKNYIVVPVVNPDGYAYTWSTNRMWRKNRSKSSARAHDSKCVGVSAGRGGHAPAVAVAADHQSSTRSNN
jgi:hypothetical protein